MNRLSGFALLGLAAVCAAQPQGSVSGTVTNLAGEPLRNVTLGLMPDVSDGGKGATYAAASDAHGAFQFDEVMPGGYSLFSERAGYLNGELGDTLTVDPGQSVTGITIKMTPQAVIAGRVVDDDGSPAQGFAIVVERWRYVDGKRQLLQYGSDSTDFEGAYSISGLEAGSYIVSVSPAPGILRNALRKRPFETVPRTYYPGVTDRASATTVRVSAGGVLRGLDIRVRKMQTYRIHGTVAGNEALSRFVQLIQEGVADAGSPEAMVGSIAGERGFEFDSVLPGRYTLEAFTAGEEGADHRKPSAGYVGRQAVAVGNGDIDDVLLHLEPAAQIHGTVEYEGTATIEQVNQRPWGIRAIVALVTPEGEGNTRVDCRFLGDGAFDIQGIMPGRYHVEVTGASPGSYVKSVVYGGQDVTRSMLDLASGSVGEMKVTLSYNVAKLGGFVLGPDGKPVPDATVTVWSPGTPAANTFGFMESRVAGSNGAFAFSDLPPGDYRVAAWERIEEGIDTVPEFRNHFETRAAAVKLKEGDLLAIQAPLIPASEVESAASKLQ